MKHKKLNTLVILSPGFPENEADSTCIPPQQIFVKALKEVSPELNIIVLTFQYPFFSNEYLWHGIKVISFGGVNKGRIFRLFIGLRVWMALRKLNKSHKIIGLLSFWLGKSALIGSLFAKQYQLTHFCWLLGQDAKSGNKYFYKVKPKGSFLIALSDFIVQEFKKNYDVVPQHIIPVGIAPILFSKEPADRDIDVIGVGSLIPLKQYDVFLKVISSLKLTHPKIKAVICGDGPEMIRLNAMLETMGLQNNVSLTGRLAHHEVLKLMQRSKVHLHTANYEGFGAVCLEALYAGAQVVSFVKPMDTVILKWHHVYSPDHMIKKVKDILNDPFISYESIMPYAITDNAKAMLKLFNYNVEAIS